ncbi:MAG: aminodeoxychorismate/anthranilate synthase component II [Bacteroidia bacterium]|jgi:anthranilate synthase component 2|nr:aminodeoxychorismate/anthranilate synthase component II [Bacteroidia bacterium]
MNRILVFDNYDSFTYNLVHLVETLTDAPVDVVRNDELPLEEAEAYSHIILSPGPGIPEEAGALLPLIERYAGRKNMLGVCLGHQAIAQALGAKLINLGKVFHGVATPVSTLDNPGYLFEGIPHTFLAGRYHSWVVDESSMPSSLRITARDESGQIMAFEHESGKLAGVQFHPESILTEHGALLMCNFLNAARQ